MKLFTLLLAGVVLALGASSPVMAQTNYPASSTLELRDANGNLLSSTTPTCPEDGISVHATGWQPNSSVHATFHSDPVDLGNHPVDGSGSSDFTFRVFDVDPGMHTLRLEGLGSDGHSRVVEASILCQCNPKPGQPTAVLGQTLDNVAGSAGSDGSSRGSGFFGKTGLDVTKLLAVGIDLVLIGVVLQLAKSRRLMTSPAKPPSR